MRVDPPMLLMLEGCVHEGRRPYVLGIIIMVKRASCLLLRNKQEREEEEETAEGKILYLVTYR